MTGFTENFLNPEVIARSSRLLFIGLITTFKLVILSVIIAMVLGLILAVLRNTNKRWLNPLLIAYTDVLRSCPIIVLLMLIYYALPFVNIKLPALGAAILAISVNGSAYYAEIFRSGIEAVSKGQHEASRSLGLSYLQTMGNVVLPQAFRIVLPPLTTNTLELIKGSAVASTVALSDILRQAMQAQSMTMNATPLVVAWIVYLILLLPFVQLIHHFEARSKAG